MKREKLLNNKGFAITGILYSMLLLFLVLLVLIINMLTRKKIILDKEKSDVANLLGYIDKEYIFTESSAFNVPVTGYYKIEIWGGASTGCNDVKCGGSYVQGTMLLTRDDIYLINNNHVNSSFSSDKNEIIFNVGGGYTYTDTVSGFKDCVVDNTTTLSMTCTDNTTNTFQVINPNIISVNSYIPNLSGTVGNYCSEGNHKLCNEAASVVKITFLSSNPPVGNTINSYATNLKNSSYILVTRSQDRSLNIGGLSVDYVVNLPKSGYSFTLNRNNTNCDAQFCDLNGTCTTIDGILSPDKKRFYNDVPGYLKYDFGNNGCWLLLEQLNYNGEYVTVNPLPPEKPSYEVFRGCTLSGSTFNNCSIVNYGAVLSVNNIWLTAPYNAYNVYQYRLDDGQWINMSHTSSVNYVNITGLTAGVHKIKLRKNFSANTNTSTNAYAEILGYSQESDEFVFTIE